MALSNDLNGLQHHLRLQHSLDQSVKGVSLHIRTFIPHPQRRQEPNHQLVPGIEKPAVGFGQLLSQGRQPGPVRENLPDAMFCQNSKI